MNEIWKDIDGFMGAYQVSDRGRVRSCVRSVACRGGNVRLLASTVIKSFPQNSGYLMVNLSRGGQKHPLLVHRLVAAAFIKNENQFTDVNHIDKNKLNNSVDNLEYTSHRENIIHSNLSRNTSSNIPGVCWNKTSTKWQAYLRLNKRIKHLGLFTDKSDAITALKSAFTEHGIHNKYLVNKP